MTTQRLMASATRPPLPVLTSLRFFAAAEVVIYHEFRFASDLTSTGAFLRDMVSAGYEAVTFFFVLSGFILTYVYASGVDDGRSSTSASAFWRARWARISPAYFLGLVLAFPHLLYAAFVSRIIPISDLYLAVALVPIMQQAWWPHAAIAWNVPAWSLSVEFFFYVCFPALLLGSARVPRRSFLLVAYILVLAVACIRYALLLREPQFDSIAWNFEQYFPLFHLPQFIFGMALGRLYVFGRQSISRTTHVAIFYVGVVGLMVVLGMRSMLPAWAHTDATLVLLFGIVIFGGARVESRVLVSPIFILLGEASYAIYILHSPIGWWWVWLTRPFHFPGAVSFAIYSAILLAASVGTYLYVEKPLRRWILGHREHRSA
jgi:peptidoglycan/LPS O-acetylase OafA/YrhL